MLVGFLFLDVKIQNTESLYSQEIMICSFLVMLLSGFGTRVILAS